jgi:multimeric flavodoxin WrbA
MKIIGFNGSPRKNGNTNILMRKVFNILENQGIETELIQIPDNIKSCRACYQCKKNKDNKCVLKGDDVNEYIEKIMDSQGLILGSPVYFANVTPQMKAFIDRVGFVCRANGNLLKRKVGAGVIAVRRGGALTVFNSLNQFFLISEMVVASSNYWNFGIGGKEGDVENDAEGIATMEKLGENLAWVVKKLHG